MPAACAVLPPSLPSSMHMQHDGMWSRLPGPPRMVVNVLPRTRLDLISRSRRTLLHSKTQGFSPSFMHIPILV